MLALYWTLMAALSLLWPLQASASPSYPAALDDALELGCSPSCDLCHVNKPAFATANTPLGRTLRKASLKCCDDDGLVEVIADLEASQADSDSDGVGDVDELRGRKDPNAPATKLMCKRELLADGSRVFGTCAATPRAARATSLQGVGVLLAAAVLVRRLLRRR